MGFGISAEQLFYQPSLEIHSIEDLKKLFKGVLVSYTGFDNNDIVLLLFPRKNYRNLKNLERLES